MTTRLLKPLACTILLMLALLWTPAAYAQITVNSTADNLNAGDGNCTLREAIMNANSDSDTTLGDCAAGVGADIITLPAGTYTLTIAGRGEDANATGDLDITDTDNTTINGAGARTTVIQAGTGDPANSTCPDCVDRVLDFHTGALANLSGLTIENGDAGGFPNDGGGINTNGANLTLTDVVVQNNFVGDDGAGISLVGGGSLTASRITVTGNRANSSCGGIITVGTSMDITNSTISGNGAGGNPGVLVTDCYATAHDVDRQRCYGTVRRRPQCNNWVDRHTREQHPERQQQ